MEVTSSSLVPLIWLPSAQLPGARFFNSASLRPVMRANGEHERALVPSLAVPRVDDGVSGVYNPCLSSTGLPVVAAVRFVLARS